MVAVDHQFYDVLRAVASSLDGPSRTEGALAAATDTAPAETYVAAMIDEGWLEGVVEREPDGNVRAIFVRMISGAGRSTLAAELAHSAGPDGLAALGQISRQGAGEGVRVEKGELDRLRDFGLVMPGVPLRLTELGGLLLTRDESQAVRANTTIIQGITNSQVAVGSSRIKGDISIIGHPLERSDLVNAVGELKCKIVELEMSQEAAEEILADLATIHSQLDSPRPKRNIIRACAENVQAVLQGAVGSAVYVGFMELLKRLMT